MKKILSIAALAALLLTSGTGIVLAQQAGRGYYGGQGSWYCPWGGQGGYRGQGTWGCGWNGQGREWNAGSGNWQGCAWNSGYQVGNNSHVRGGR